MGVLVNGVNYSWTNVKFVLFGIPVVGITKIEYRKKQKKENHYGMGSEPVSRGYGNNEYEAKITLYKDEWNAVIVSAQAALNANGFPDPLALPFFDIQVTFGGGISRTPFTQDTLRAAEFTEDPFTIGQGDTRALVDIPLIIAGIDHVVT